MTKYLRLNVSAFLWLILMFFWFVCLVFVTYNLAGEKATYVKCGRFDVACSRRKLTAIIYFSPTYACQKGQHHTEKTIVDIVDSKAMCSMFIDG